MGYATLAMLILLVAAQVQEQRTSSSAVPSSEFLNHDQSELQTSGFQALVKIEEDQMASAMDKTERLLSDDDDDDDDSCDSWSDDDYRHWRRCFGHPFWG